MGQNSFQVASVLTRSLQPLHGASLSQISPSSIREDSRTFFVTSRTFGGRALLQSDRMAQLFIDVLRSYSGRFRIHDFTVMPNHFHLLITLDGELTTERAVQLIKGNFSYRAKKELGFEREVWQKGFSEDRVYDRESFLAHRRYIENNPIKAGLVRVPEGYPYCSTYLRRMKSAAAEAE